jgi:hypothetical protein
MNGSDTMSDTPRTDAALKTGYRINRINGNIMEVLPAVPADFSRQLERELSAANAERNNLRDRILASAELIESAACLSEVSGNWFATRAFRAVAAYVRTSSAASARVHEDMVRGLDMIEKAMGTKDEAGQ